MLRLFCIKNFAPEITGNVICSLPKSNVIYCHHDIFFTLFAHNWKRKCSVSAQLKLQCLQDFWAHATPPPPTHFAHLSVWKLTCPGLLCVLVCLRMSWWVRIWGHYSLMYGSPDGLSSWAWCARFTLEKQTLKARRRPASSTVKPKRESVVMWTGKETGQSFVDVQLHPQSTSELVEEIMLNNSLVGGVQNGKSDPGFQLSSEELTVKIAINLFLQGQFCFLLPSPPSNHTKVIQWRSPLCDSKFTLMFLWCLVSSKQNTSRQRCCSYNFSHELLVISYHLFWRECLFFSRYISGRRIKAGVCLCS